MLIQQMLKRLYNVSSFEDTARVILDDSIALHGAELGTLQVKAGDHLVIVVHRGFRRPFLEFFSKVTARDECACGRALKTGRTVIVPDIEKDEDFAPYRDVARAAGVRSVVTTPLLTHERFLVGAVSTHFVNIHKPTAIEIETLKSYSVAAANQLVKLLGESSLNEKAMEMSRRLYEETDLVPLSVSGPQGGAALGRQLRSYGD